MCWVGVVLSFVFCTAIAVSFALFRCFALLVFVTLYLQIVDLNVIFGLC